jgi:hypothetical protein
VYKCHEAIYLSLIIRIIVLLVWHELFTTSLPKDMIKLRLAGSNDCSRYGLEIIGGLCLIAQLEEKLPSYQYFFLLFVAETTLSHPFHFGATIRTCNFFMFFSAAHAIVFQWSALIIRHSG